MINTYSTSDVAKLIGIHPNTVRLYENLGLITRPERKINGYRVFTDYHLIQFRIARLAFQVEVLQNGLRKQAAAIVKSCASGDMDKALYLTDLYLRQISEEKLNGETAIQIAGQILSGIRLLPMTCFSRGHRPPSTCTSPWTRCAAGSATDCWRKQKTRMAAAFTPPAIWNG